jgi:hypothetical protein
MFKVDIYLIVVSQEPNKYIVEQDLSFPKKSLTSDKTPKAIAAQLLFDLTRLNEVWASMLSIGVSESSITGLAPDTVILPYVCFIPEPVRVSGEDVCWASYQTLKEKAEPLTLALVHEVAYKKI